MGGMLRRRRKGQGHDPADGEHRRRHAGRLCEDQEATEASGTSSRAADFKSPVTRRRWVEFDVPNARLGCLGQVQPTLNSALPLLRAGFDQPARAPAVTTLDADCGGSDGSFSDQHVRLLAGLDPLVPWLQRWHNEPYPELGGR